MTYVGSVIDHFPDLRKLVDYKRNYDTVTFYMNENHFTSLCLGIHTKRIDLLKYSFRLHSLVFMSCRDDLDTQFRTTLIL